MKRLGTKNTPKKRPSRRVLVAGVFALLSTAGCDPQEMDAFSQVHTEELRGETGQRDLVIGIEKNGPSLLTNDEYAGKGTPSGEALTWLNRFRTEAGLIPVTYDSNVEQAAQGHAFFIAEHRDLYQAGISFHDEIEGKTGFLAEKYWERQAMFNSKGKALGEVIAFHRSTEAAMAQWMESVYHRIPLLDTRAITGAYALQVRADNAYGVLELTQLNSSQEAVQDTKWVAYPVDGASLVPTSWDGKESPQPMAPPGGYPSGPVFTLSAADNAPVRIAKATLLDENGHAIPHTLLDATNDGFFEAQTGLALYANDPLEAGATYTIQLSGFRGDQVFQWSSTFTTTPKTDCNLLGQETCGTGKACYPKAGATSCEWQGVIPEGGECTYQNDCASGTTCVQEECRKLCDSGNEGWFACDKVCDEGNYSKLGDHEDVGVCTPPACSPHEDRCAQGTVCQVASTMNCGIPGKGQQGDSCHAPDGCAQGLACTLQSGTDGMCQPLCSLGEPENGSSTELPVCSELCASGTWALPQHPGLGVCPDL
jgi:hypothetical protein